MLPKMDFINKLVERGIVEKSTHNLVIKYLRGKTGKKFGRNAQLRGKTYRAPSDNMVYYIRKLLNALEKTSPKQVAKYMKYTKMRAMVFDDIIVFSSVDRSKNAINFLWRPGTMTIPTKKTGTVDPMIMSAPHEGTDNTLSISVNCFLRTKARILVSNAVHNHEGGQGLIGCQKKRWIADGAHVTSTLFHQTMMILADMYPYAAFPQFHGMVGARNFKMLISSCYRANFDLTPKSCPQLFGVACKNNFSEEELRTFAFAGRVPAMNKIYRRPGSTHNTTVTARGLNFGGQCSLGARDTGRFMHMELAPEFRVSTLEPFQANVEKLSSSLNGMINLWNATEIPPNILKKPEPKEEDKDVDPQEIFDELEI